MKNALQLWPTRDLDASVAFYRRLLSAEPAKHFADYALFVCDEPGLELALDHNAETNVLEGAHYGVAVDRPEDVDEAIVRLRAAGYPIEVETTQTCCYAVQNKVWATGSRWTTLGNLLRYRGGRRTREEARPAAEPKRDRAAGADVLPVGEPSARATAECVGTAFLSLAVVGSGIMAQRLSGGNVGRPARKYDRDRRCAWGDHPGLWTDLRRASQSGRDVRRCLAARHRLAGRSGLHRSASRWLPRGRRERESHVWAPDLFCVASRPDRQWAMAGRVRRDVRPAVHHLGLFQIEAHVDTIGRRRVYCRRLLVYVVDLVCEPRRDNSRDRSATRSPAYARSTLRSSSSRSCSVQSPPPRSLRISCRSRRRSHQRSSLRRRFRVLTTPSVLPHIRNATVDDLTAIRRIYNGGSKIASPRSMTRPSPLTT